MQQKPYLWLNTSVWMVPFKAPHSLVLLKASFLLIQIQTSQVSILKWSRLDDFFGVTPMTLGTIICLWYPTYLKKQQHIIVIPWNMFDIKSIVSHSWKTKHHPLKLLETTAFFARSPHAAAIAACTVLDWTTSSPGGLGKTSTRGVVARSL